MGRPPRQSLTSMLIEAVTERIHSGPVQARRPAADREGHDRGVRRQPHRGSGGHLEPEGQRPRLHPPGQGRLRAERGGAGRSTSPRTSSLSPKICSRRWRFASPSNSEAAALAARRRTTEQLAAIWAACDAMDAALLKGEETVALDIAFHRSIAEATGNRHFVGLFNYLGEVLMTRARLSVSGAQLSTTP